MSSLKFGQEEVASKDFHKQRQLTDISVMQVNGEVIMLLFIKRPKNIFSYSVSQYDKNSA